VSLVCFVGGGATELRHVFVYIFLLEGEGRLLE
jgi:hypothetical protein